MSPTSLRGPRIRPLTSRQMAAVLARNYVGRMAFVLHGHIELHPVHYVYSNGALYGRTSFGAKYVAWMHEPYVAFEVDEISGPFDWSSVVVKGTVYVLGARGAPAMRADYRKAVAAIRAVLPAAFTARDPTPYRGVVFRLQPHEMTGRSATTR
jgi:uncharacterized protein